MSPAQAHIFQGVSSPVALRQNLVGEKKFPGKAEPHACITWNEWNMSHRKKVYTTGTR